jgi:hypothetical protein
MANTFVNMTKVSEDILIDFHNELNITGTAWKGYEKDLTNQSWSTGGTVTIPLPVNYIVGDGATITGTSDTTENSDTLTVSYRKNVQANFTSKEMTFDSDVKFRERFIKPMAKNLANIVDKTTADEIKYAVYNHIGTAGTLPNTYKSAAAAGVSLNKLGVRSDDRWLGFNEDAYLEVISAGTLQNSNDVNMTRDINRKFLMGGIADMTTYHSVYMPTHIAGIGDSSATPASGVVAAGNVKTTVTSGNSIVVENLQASDTGVFLKGDKITIAGVFKVNPISLETTNELMQFVVLADANSSAGGEATITVSPSIISSSTSPYRNISSTTGIAGGAGSTISLATANTGSGSTVKVPYKISVAYVPEAILFAAPKLAMPVDGMKGMKQDPETGIAIRTVADYDVLNDKNIWRTDIQFGIKIKADRMVAILG